MNQQSIYSTQKPLQSILDYTVLFYLTSDGLNRHETRDCAYFHYFWAEGIQCGREWYFKYKDLQQDLNVQPDLRLAQDGLIEI